MEFDADLANELLKTQYKAGFTYDSSDKKAPTWVIYLTQSVHELSCNYYGSTEKSWYFKQKRLHQNGEHNILFVAEV